MYFIFAGYQAGFTVEFTFQEKCTTVIEHRKTFHPERDTRILRGNPWIVQISVRWIFYRF